MTAPVSTAQDDARSPEANLVLSVLLQAVEDARQGDEEAWRFLTDPRGSWARARSELCWLLTVDPDDVRRWVLSELTPPRTRPVVDTTSPLTDRIVELLEIESPLHIRELAYRAGCPRVEGLSTTLGLSDCRTGAPRMARRRWSR